MANETNKTVTISADYFAELYEAKKDKDQYSEAVLNIAKERDELKAKLEAEQSTDANIGILYAMKWKDRIVAAERCIDEIEGNIICTTSWENKLKIIEDAIREYRETKESK